MWCAGAAALLASGTAEPPGAAPAAEPHSSAPDAKALYQKYADRAAQEKNVTFAGRLATYRYYNMDQVVGMALAEFDRLKSSSRV